MTTEVDGKKKTTLKHLAHMVDGDLCNAQEEDFFIHGVNEVKNAMKGEITFIVKSAGVADLSSSRASAAVVSLDAHLDLIDIPVLRVKDPYLAISIIHNYFLSSPFKAEGISPAAHIGADCHIPDEVTIGPCAVLGRQIVLGKRVTIHPGAVIGDNVRINNDSVIHPNVTIYPSTVIGARVIIHSGSVIGSDGYGYATDEQGVHVKRPHVGYVEVEDDVEIGANVCVDRATFGITRIGRGTKIDNLVQIGHNVQVGPDCLIVSQVGVAGSTKLGSNVMIGGQTALAGHIEIGDRVMVGAKSGVAGSQPAGAVVSGIPAIAHPRWRRATAVFAQLPEIIKDIRKLKKSVNDILSRIS